MANTLPDVTIPKGVWVDLYDETSIAVGTAVTITNKGSYPILIAASLAEPASTAIGAPLYPGPFGSVAVVDAGEAGLWAYAKDNTSYVLVQD